MRNSFGDCTSYFAGERECVVKKIPIAFWISSYTAALLRSKYLNLIVKVYGHRHLPHGKALLRGKALQDSFFCFLQRSVLSRTKNRYL